MISLALLQPAINLEPRTLLYVLGIAVLIVLTALVTLRIRHYWQVWTMQRRFARGRRGEARAVALLAANGYQVLDEQVTCETAISVDGEWRPVKVRADLIAMRAGRRFVVEVKTGQQAPDPASAATRRQLFEYHHAFDADGLLLADMERERLMEIGFRPAPLAPARMPVRWGIALFLTGVVCGIAGMLYF